LIQNDGVRGGGEGEARRERDRACEVALGGGPLAEADLRVGEVVVARGVVGRGGEDGAVVLGREVEAAQCLYVF
jgi:hypothetical protein